jgi:hypothetical protein
MGGDADRRGSCPYPDSASRIAQTNSSTYRRTSCVPSISTLLDDSLPRAFRFPPRTKPCRYAEQRHRAYPRGQAVADLGPARVEASLEDVGAFLPLGTDHT